MDMKGLMKQAQQMQAEMAKKQEELAAMKFEAAAGGRMVKVVVSGKHELLGVTIDPAIVTADDREMLEDLVVAAVNEAFRKANEAAQQAMSGMLGGLGALPNLFGG